MKPPVFDYIRATDVEHAVSELGAGGVSPIAGGQSLMQELTRRRTRPRAVLDLNRLSQLDYIVEREGMIAIGALTRYRSVEKSALVADRIALLPEALGYVGHATIRHRGTVGGSLAYGDPAGEFPCSTVVLGAQITLASIGGTRTVDADGFFTGPYSTVRSDAELVTEIAFPIPPAHVAWSVAEFSRRHRDYAVVAVEAGIGLDDAGRIDYARIGVAGGGQTVWRSRRGETELLGQRPDATLIADAADTVAGESSPLHSVHADIEHRRHLVRVMTERALSGALTTGAGVLR